MDNTPVFTNQDGSQQQDDQPPLSEVRSNRPSKKSVALIAVGLVLVLGLAGWFLYNKIKPASQAKSGTYNGKVTIGYTAWPGYVGLYLARDKGYFKQHGVDVELRLYDSFGELSDAYTSGRIQGKANLGLDAVSETYAGLDHKVIAAIDHSNGSDGIIGSPEVTSFEQLKGKKVAFEHGALDDFFIRYVLEQKQMTLDDIIPVDLNAEDSAQALVDGQVSAAATYEPFMSKALAESKGHMLFSSAEAPGLISDLLTFHSDFIDDYPATVQAIVNANLEGVAFWKSNPDEANGLIAKELGVAKEEVLAQLGGITILDKQGNLTAFTFSSGLKSLYGNLRTVNNFIKTQEGNQSKNVETDDLIDPRFVRGLLE